jgi:hypothetical protein
MFVQAHVHECQMQNLLKRQQAADVRNGYFQSFPQGFNLAALDAFGPP